MIATCVRIRCGIWVEDQRVIDSSPALYWAATARHSMAMGARRWLTRRWVTILCAPANAFSMSPPPFCGNGNVNAMLFSNWGCTLGESGFIAASTSTAAGRGSYSISTRSAASLPAYRSDATMATTGSPTKRTASTASTGWNGTFNPGIAAAHGTEPMRCETSLPVSTSTTPADAFAASVLTETMFALAWTLRTKVT